MPKPAKALMLALAALVGFLSQYPQDGKPEAQQARAFMPGYWGYEHGNRQAAPSAGAWLSRCLYGVTDKKHERAWYDFNHLGPSLSFSHNLSRIIRPEDYASHPEWFPLIAGVRFKPNPARLNWQPDLGSEEVIAHTAAIAVASLSREFKFKSRRSEGSATSTLNFNLTVPADRVPSFALGINDALIYGESPGVLRWASPPTFFRGRPNYSNLIFDFTNRVAQKVEHSLFNYEEPKYLRSNLRGYFHEAKRTLPMKTPLGSTFGSSVLGVNNSDCLDLPLLGVKNSVTPPGSTTPATVPSPSHLAPRPSPIARGSSAAAWLLGCLAYYWCEQVPDFPVHPNVVPFLCADRSQAYDPAFWAEEKALQDAWARRGPRRLGIYDYCYGYGFLIPRIHTRIIIEHLTRARRIGFTDYFAEVNANWGLDGPQPWLIAQLLAHPEADGHALLDEYYRRYFAEAAGPMRRFFERCEEIWMSQPGPVDWLKYYRNESQAELFPSAECAKLRCLLDEAAAMARSEKIRRRVDLVGAAFGATERLARLWEAKKALSQELGAKSSRLKASLAALKAAETDLIDTVDRLGKSHPLALHRGIPMDFLWMSPASAAKALLADQEEIRLQQTASSESPDRSAQFLGFEGPAQPGQRIAGLQYKAELPQGWNNRLEPADGMVTQLCPEAARSGSVGLRLERHKYASIFSWNPLWPNKRSFRASAYVRGRPSPAARIVLQVSFLNAKSELIDDVRGMRFIPETWLIAPRDGTAGDAASAPPGATAPWTRLTVAGEAPSDAAWIGVSIQAAYMLPGDSVDVDDVQLQMLPAPRHSN